MFRNALVLAVVGLSSLAFADVMPITPMPGSNIVYTANGHKYALHVPLTSEHFAPLATPAADTHAHHLHESVHERLHGQQRQH